MEYRRLEENWQEAERAGDIETAMDLLEQQITENLLTVRNAFADDIADDPDVAFGFLFDISDIKLEYQDVIEEFYNLGEEREDIFMDREIADGKNSERDFLERYIALEKKTIDAMQKYDDAYILRELCNTLKEKVGRLKITFFGLWVGRKNEPKSVDGVYGNYVEHIQIGGDPVVLVETIQAKLKAIRNRTGTSDETQYTAVNAIQRQLISIAAAMEEVFKEYGCDTDVLEKALSHHALYHGNWRQKDMETIDHDFAKQEGKAMNQIMSLINLAWTKTCSLDNAIQRIVLPIMGQEDP